MRHPAPTRTFTDRLDAGRRLAPLVADRLAATASGSAPVVLGLPRGGVPVAAEVARALDAPLDVIVVRKLGVPHHPELAMGAIGEDGVRVVNDRVRREAGITADALAAVEATERTALTARLSDLRRRWPRIDLRDRTAVIVDDGIATGATARAAAAVARAHGAARVMLAVPVAPADVQDRFAGVVDNLVVTTTPPDFHAVGEHYDRFDPTPDAEVLAGLADAAGRRQN